MLHHIIIFEFMASVSNRIVYPRMETASEAYDLVTCCWAAVYLLILSLLMNFVTFATTQGAQLVAPSALLSHQMLSVLNDNAFVDHQILGLLFFEALN